MFGTLTIAPVSTPESERVTVVPGLAGFGKSETMEGDTGAVVSLSTKVHPLTPVFPDPSVCDTEIATVPVPSEILRTSNTVDHVPVGLHATL